MCLEDLIDPLPSVLPTEGWKEFDEWNNKLYSPVYRTYPILEGKWIHEADYRRGKKPVSLFGIRLTAPSPRTLNCVYSSKSYPAGWHVFEKRGQLSNLHLGTVLRRVSVKSITAMGYWYGDRVIVCKYIYVHPKEE